MRIVGGEAGDPDSLIDDEPRGPSREQLGRVGGEGEQQPGGEQQRGHEPRAPSREQQGCV